MVGSNHINTSNSKTGKTDPASFTTMSNLVASASNPGTDTKAPANTSSNTNTNTNTELGSSRDKPPVAELNLDLDDEGNLNIPTQRESFSRVPYIHAPISAGIPSAFPNTSSLSASARRLSSLTGGLFLSPSPNLNLSPGTFPLVIQTPHDGGIRKQIEVQHTATVADIKWKLANEFGIQNATLVFDDKALNNDQATLEDYNIPSAYDVAGGILWAIEEGNLNASEKIMALDPALAIIEGIRKGEVNLDDFSGKNNTGGAVHSHKADELSKSYELSKASSLPPLPSSHNHSDMGSQETASNPKATAEAAATAALTKSVDGRTSPIDYPQVVAKLNEKMPNLYKRDAVNALTSAWSSHDPLAMPPSALPRFESGGWLDDKLPSVTGTTPIISGSSAENSTPTWLEQISRNWQQSTVDRIVSNNESKLVDASDEPQDGTVKNEQGGDGGDDLDNKTGGKNDEDDEDDDEEFDEDDEDSGSGSENSGSKYTQGNTGSAGADDAGKDGNDPNVRRPKKRGRKRKYPEMTEEQRAELRKKQNRESAKKSRQRKKKMSQQYEEMIQNVMQENRELKDQLSALGKRLEMMQQLLTVHVVQDSAAPVPQSAYRGGNMLNPPQWRGNAMQQQQQASQPPQQPMR